MAKTRRRLLKQFAILNASAKIAFSPEIHDLAQNRLFTGASMLEAALAGKDHGSAGFVTGLNDLVIV